MKCQLEVRKTLITDNGKEFSVGQDIAFKLKGKDNNYIGKVKELKQSVMTITSLQFNNINVDGDMVVFFSDIEDNTCDYVYTD